MACGGGNLERVGMSRPSGDGEPVYLEAMQPNERCRQRRTFPRERPLADRLSQPQTLFMNTSAHQAKEQRRLASVKPSRSIN